MNLDQTRAVLAYKHIQGVASDESQKAKYGIMALKLPILVRSAGLCQALHFVQSRGTPSHNVLLSHLAEQLKRVDPRITDADSLCKQVREATMQTYLHLTREATATLQWYARLAQSVLKVERTSEEDSDGET